MPAAVMMASSLGRNHFTGNTTGNRVYEAIAAGQGCYNEI